MIEEDDVRRKRLFWFGRFLEFGVRDARGQETRELGDSVQEQGITAGFPSTHEGDGMILIFMLRRIGSCGGARCWPLTVGWVM